jgi:hypothetical protein
MIGSSYYSTIGRSDAMTEPFRFTCPEGHPCWVPLTPDHRVYADVFGFYCRTCDETYEVELTIEADTHA